MIERVRLISLNIFLEGGFLIILYHFALPEVGNEHHRHDLLSFRHAPYVFRHESIHVYTLHAIHVYTMRHTCISCHATHVYITVVSGAFPCNCWWLSSGYMRSYKVDTRITTL